MAIFALDLTQRSPRSPRVRIGGYAILARALDKGRATIVKKNGEFNYDCPLDKMCFDFIGITGAEVKAKLAKGASDSDILAWIEKSHPKCPAQIDAWSKFMEGRAPSSVDSRGYFNETVKKCAPKREDISTWFEMLDVDDYTTFGGQA
ncbi:MAG TPA: DUF5069 domain-containing protein [Opitutales bacterium]|jgi:hypothetical protein|nr:DUF5069 domain-containing protein [Opitutales bacterium]